MTTCPTLTSFRVALGRNAWSICACRAAQHLAQSRLARNSRRHGDTAFMRAIVQYRRGQHKRARALAWALGLFFGSILFNLPVNREIIEFVHLSDFGFISLLVHDGPGDDAGVARPETADARRAGSLAGGDLPQGLAGTLSTGQPAVSRTWRMSTSTTSSARPILTFSRESRPSASMRMRSGLLETAPGSRERARSGTGRQPPPHRDPPLSAAAPGRLRVCGVRRISRRHRSATKG